MLWWSTRWIITTSVRGLDDTATTTTINAGCRHLLLLVSGKKNTIAAIHKPIHKPIQRPKQLRKKRRRRCHLPVKHELLQDPEVSLETMGPHHEVHQSGVGQGRARLHHGSQGGRVAVLQRGRLGRRLLQFSCQGRSTWEAEPIESSKLVDPQVENLQKPPQLETPIASVASILHTIQIWFSVVTTAICSWPPPPQITVCVPRKEGQVFDASAKACGERLSCKRPISAKSIQPKCAKCCAATRSAPEPCLEKVEIKSQERSFPASHPSDVSSQ